MNTFQLLFRRFSPGKVRRRFQSCARILDNKMKYVEHIALMRLYLHSAEICGGQPLRLPDPAGNILAIAAAQTVPKMSALEHLASLK